MTVYVLEYGENLEDEPGFHLLSIHKTHTGAEEAAEAHAEMELEWRCLFCFGGPHTTWTAPKNSTEGYYIQKVRLVK